MTVESATYLNDLNSSLPAGTDQKSEGNDHIALIKAVVKATFPGLSGRAFRAQSKSGTYTAAATDNTTLLNFSATATLNLLPAATAGNGYLLFLTTANGTTLTIDPDGTEQVNGVSSATLNDNDFGILLCDGTRWHFMYIQNAASTLLTGPTLTRPIESSVREQYSSPGSVSGAITADFQGHGFFVYTLGGNITLSFSNVPSSAYVFSATFVLTQDGTGGRTVTWPGAVKWPSGVAPTLSGANKTDVITLITWDGGTSWLGFIAGQNFS